MSRVNWSAEGDVETVWGVWQVKCEKFVERGAGGVKGWKDKD